MASIDNLSGRRRFLDVRLQHRDRAEAQSATEDQLRNGRAERRAALHAL